MQGFRRWPPQPKNVCKRRNSHFETVIADDKEILILFIKLQNSPLLAEHFFIERELHAFVATRKGPIVAVLDTSRAGLDADATLLVGRPWRATGSRDF